MADSAHQGGRCRKWASSWTHVGAVNRWIQECPRGVVLASGAALATLSAAVLAILQTPTWLRISTAVLSFALALAIEVNKEVGRRRDETEARTLSAVNEDLSEQSWRKSIESALHFWPLPTVPEANPYALGVTRSDVARRVTQLQPLALPPYVARDVEQRCRELLRRTGSLLIVGAPGSGVTRTAYELARGLPARTLLLAPQCPEGLRAALDDLNALSRVSRTSSLLLWLDRIDEFSRFGLTSEMIRRVGRANPGLRVIATISSVAFPAWDRSYPDISGAFADTVFLDRALSERERDDAQLAYPDLDLAYGLAPGLTSKAALLRQIRGGNSMCPFDSEGEDCQAVRILLGVLGRWAATGTRRPLPERLIPILASENIDSPHLNEAISWALRPVPAGPPLASRPESCFLQLHEDARELVLEDETTVSAAVWSAALDEATTADDSEAVGRIGLRAFSGGSNVISERAWSRILSIREPGARFLEDAAELHVWPDCEYQVRRHLTRIATNDFGQASIEWAIAASREARVIWIDGHGVEQADQTLAECQRIFEANGRHHDPELVAITLRRAALALEADIQTAEALSWLRDVREISQSRRFEPPIQWKLAHLLFVAHLKQGDPIRAKAFADEAVAIAESDRVALDALKLANALSNQGTVYRVLHEYAEAKSVLFRALDLATRSKNPAASRHVMHIARELRGMYSQAKDNESAAPMAELALKRAVEYYGESSKETMLCKVRLAHDLAHEDLGAAIQTIDEVIPDLVRLLGPNHKYVAQAYLARASTWCRASKPMEAIPDHEKSLAIYLDGTGTGRSAPSVAAGFWALGQEWRHAGDMAEAQKYFEMALDQARQLFPPGSRVITTYARDLRSVATDVFVAGDGTVARTNNARSVNRPQ
jgi:tetratricopeptide (TPR) repeat protein